jgi:hypothetical protein
MIPLKTDYIDIIPNIQPSMCITTIIWPIMELITVLDSCERVGSSTQKGQDIKDGPLE